MTWSQTLIPDQYNVVSSLCLSADGDKLAATVYGGGIYTEYFGTPSPRLDIGPSSGGVNLSWLVPSSSFVLQENADLTTTNWTDMQITPTLNFTNLNHEVMVSPTNGRGFFRLKQQ